MDHLIPDAEDLADMAQLAAEIPLAATMLAADLLEAIMDDGFDP